ncbi:uncharacterized protein OCT59_004605 [Rhizophagus irregularis]|uniref:uncharacterized protein n=1 Tax=Rhizophagus irregularis TaxID=588596 RepID=UPI0033224683|nr:hypothetical protein OCT59_004605 [Rhizophagus irregularis]
MDLIKLSDDVIEQIKDFKYRYLTEEQESLIDKLITDKELKERCKKYAKGGFGTTFKAVWKDGHIWGWDFNINVSKLRRESKTKVALKCLHNSQDITADFLKEVESNILVYESKCNYIVRCFGITKDPKTNNFMMVMDLKNGNLRQHLNNNFISMDWKRKLWILQNPLKRPNADELENLFISLWSNYHEFPTSLIRKQAEVADEINKKSSSTVQSPLSSTSTLTYMIHPQAVYTSRLLSFKNLPEPKNANNDDLEYSDSLRMDFTKLDINSKIKEI